jgi:glycosyltransferase involved in cell wall biosynthesis
MIEGEEIVCFAHDWGGDPTSKTHIMRLLAKKNRVLWVNSIAMRRPVASKSDARRLIAKLRRTFAGCVEIEPNIFVVNPLVLPLPGSSLVHRLNGQLLVRSLRRVFSKLSIRKPILWTFLPVVNRLIGRLDERLVVYHCVDKYAEFSGVPREAILEMERDVIRRADLVFTSAERLFDECRPLNSRTYFIAHGVDVSHFARSLDPKTPVPEELTSIRRPIVGFFGLIADWVDLALVRALALERPQWSFVLIGKVATDLAPLRGLSNVYCLGQKPYGDLPGYCRGFDVALIPFVRNELTLRVNPLKLREYLAAGLPVVSTPLPEIARYDGLVHLAERREEFIEGIETALGRRSPELDRRRVEAMKSESWEMRVAEMSALVEQSLRTKS